MSSTTKNAQYTLKIKADSGYRSEESGRTDAECYRVALAALAGELGTDRNLIASAPDLLEALQAVVKQWDYIYPDLKWHDQEYLEDVEFREMQAARAAIAKARG
ncbi:hypothetical protein PHLH8_20740 [Pseudomonas sp. Pc102]|uniref:hypothetical protein n=1 Tax=Pseudomonas sp. Pc102 TaxID=2678261 RepID=UPI001BCC9349|nr:hypothetical protein [Pseudomonas sp. Pc102]BBP82432.1 hypothetical protein PHLH8_20740 [Pseudomonas sp. Pc102]